MTTMHSKPQHADRVLANPECFIALLPEEKRRGHKELTIPPRAESNAEIAIEAKGLTKRFGDFTAVDDVSFRIRKGEIFGFLGSNGCGKTTTMKMLTGLPDSMKASHLEPGAGHYGIFAGKSWRLNIRPLVLNFIDANSPKKPVIALASSN